MAPTALESTAELSIRADAGEVRHASTWIEQACRHFGVPAKEIGRLDVCLNEALANILAHGGTAALSAPIILRLEVNHGEPRDEATVTVTDSGVAFDPLTVSPRALPQTLAEAEPGGLGLMMMRRSVDRLSYRHGEYGNQLSFGVTWDGHGNV